MCKSPRDLNFVWSFKRGADPTPSSTPNLVSERSAAGLLEFDDTRTWIVEVVDGVGIVFSRVLETSLLHKLSDEHSLDSKFSVSFFGIRLLGVTLQYESCNHIRIHWITMKSFRHILV
jgi:hypothetical protein